MTILVAGLVGFGLAVGMAGILFRSARRRARDRESRQLRLNQSRDSICRAARDVYQLMVRERYLNRPPVERWLSGYRHLEQIVTMRIGDLHLDSTTTESVTICRRMFEDALNVVESRNHRWVAGELERMSGWFESVEEYPLSERQREAIVKDEDHCLVVAGAGTGKTSTVVGKVGYMLMRGHARPEEILVLAFARKAKEELETRIRARFKIDMEVRTFHSLGLSILGEASGRLPTLSKVAEDEMALNRLLEQILESLFADASFKAVLTEFFAFHLQPAASEFEFKSKADYYRHIRAVRLRTLKGERVRSHAEIVIANWLFVNGIQYLYESPYEVDTADSDRRQYQPDFHLPEHGIYLEHFGIGRDGSTAPYVDRMKYHEQMQWKRRLHNEHGTVLVETYSYEHTEGTLLAGLKDRLAEHGVVPKPITQEQLKAAVWQAGETRPVTQLLKTFLNLFKSHPASVSDLRDAVSTHASPSRCKAFLDLFEAVYKRYQEALQREQAIDFHDMIALATASVRNGSYASPFTCVIVDEFQDISQGRAALIKALLAQAPDPRLFCVGDDWQSIYRFTGSDLSLMTQFEQFFGPACRTDLDRTFRYDDQLVKASTEFITHNPQQLRKTLHAHRTGDRPAVKVVLGDSADSVDASLNKALEEIASEAANARVMILGRYNFTLEELPRQLLTKYSNLTIETRTVHAAKGLEADYVVVADVSGGRYGFPSEIVDDPLLDLILSAEGGFPNAEERRLFYVAMTRARHRLYLLADEASCSCFITELESAAFSSLVEIVGGNHEKATCRVCHGRLVRRRGEYGEFWGCEHFPLCTGKGVACPKCRRGVLVDEGRCNVQSCEYQTSRCGACRDGFMMPRNGRYGPFHGCSNYPDCTYTRDGRRRIGR